MQCENVRCGPQLLQSSGISVYLAKQLPIRGGGGGGCVHFARILCQVSTLASARVLEHSLNTVNLNGNRLATVGSVHQHHSLHQTGKPTFWLDSINRDRFRTTPEKALAGQAGHFLWPSKFSNILALYRY